MTVSDDRRSFEFFSEGPRGKIKKTIVYTRIGPGLYNLAFGDWNKEMQALDDSNRTNNGDRDMVLATVAHTALDFFKLFPKAKLFIEGSTYSRTRLYQMGINANFAEITEKFEIQGFVDESWEPFIHGCNYEAFLISMK